LTSKEGERGSDPETNNLDKGAKARACI